MAYLQGLLSESWNDTWNLVVQNGVSTILASLLIAFFTAIVVHELKGHTAMKDWIKDLMIGSVGTVMAAFLMFLVFFFYLTPKRLAEKRVKEGGDIAAANVDLKNANNRLQDQKSDLIAKLSVTQREGEIAAAKLDVLAIAAGVNPKGGLNEKVDYFLKNFDSTKATIEELAAIREAEIGYHNIAMLNLIGKPFADGDLIYNTPISKILEGSYTAIENNVTFHSDVEAMEKFRAVISLEPKFPFSYLALGVALRERGDSSWSIYLAKAEEILAKTTLVPGHHPNHDHFLKIVKESIGK